MLCSVSSEDYEEKLIAGPWGASGDPLVIFVIFCFVVFFVTLTCVFMFKWGELTACTPVSSQQMASQRCKSYQIPVNPS